MIEIIASYPKGARWKGLLLFLKKITEVYQTRGLQEPFAIGSNSKTPNNIFNIFLLQTTWICSLTILWPLNTLPRKSCIL